MAKPPANLSGAEPPEPLESLPICGIVRPIAEMSSEYPSSHWLDVHRIVSEAARDAGYELKLVSEADRSGIIVSEIINNLYNNPVVICDVSGKNPNVMFELGMRVTFEKPVIIITDDKTAFSFDIGPIKHIVYRRDLRFPNMLAFKEELSAAITATVAAANDPNHKGYLQQFGPIEITKLGTQQVGVEQLAEDMQEIRRSLSSLSSSFATSPRATSRAMAARNVMDTVGKFVGSIGADLMMDISESALAPALETISSVTDNYDFNQIANGDIRVSLTFSPKDTHAKRRLAIALGKIVAIYPDVAFYPLTSTGSDALTAAGIGGSMLTSL